MSNLEDMVRAVVQDFMKSEVLFTALDVSNTVKQSMPFARHREVRDVVRALFTTDIEVAGWARTPVKVSLEDGSSAEALLYHPLTDSWDLDNKYDAQRRALTSVKSQVHNTAPASFTATTVAVSDAALTVASTNPVQVSAPAVTAAATTQVVPMPTARTLWDNMFKTQPSLFPKK